MKRMLITLSVLALGASGALSELVLAGGITYDIAPMEDVVQTLKESPMRSSQVRQGVPYALPMLEIGERTPSGDYRPEVMDVDGDGADDLVLSYRLGPERFQMVLLNVGGAYEVVYMCGYTNANDPTGQFTYRGDCADFR